MKHTWLAGVFICWASAALGSDTARPCELIVERPTLTSLGFEWRIEGDANSNATCKVQYRKLGNADWREYLPLYRIGRGLTVVGITGMRYQPPEAVAGSIMDLDPGVDYEVRLELQDPDGVTGEAAKALRLRTRVEPVVPAEPVEVRHVYPPGFEGTKQKPAYHDLMHAVNGFSPMCDGYQVVHPKAAPPGTVIKVHAGLHKYDRYQYWSNRGQNHTYWLHGTATLAPKGTAEEPIYVVGAGDGEAIFDGDGCFNLFNLRGGDYIHFEGITVRNTDIAFHGGWQGERGGGIKGLTVKNCWIENVVYGVLAQDGRSEDFYIADNVILGRRNPNRREPWGRSTSGYAVNIAGQGHVVCHNYVAHFWDGINVATMSLPDPAMGQQSRAIDFYDNDIHNCGDNIIETDGGYANLRVLRNRGFNCYDAPLSAQNIFAGPVYFIRNVIWSSDRGRSAVKSHGGAAVYLYLHNTASCHFAGLNNRMQYGGPGYWKILNNISVGPAKPGPGGNCPAIATYEGAAGHQREADCNIYRGGTPDEKWRVGDETYDSLAAMQADTGLDRHSVTVEDYSLFVDAAEPDYDTRQSPFVMPQDVDLRLASDSPAIDMGTRIPGINDGFTGKAPDAGAYESGQPVPRYGPRSGPYLTRLKDLNEGRYAPTITRNDTHETE